MTDLLTAHAANQPDKFAVVDDRGGGSVPTSAHAELEARSNQPSHVLRDLDVRPASHGSNV